MDHGAKRHQFCGGMAHRTYVALNFSSSNFHRYVGELTEEFEQKLGEDRHLRIQLHEERTELHREFTETKRQVEEDIDTEIDNVR